MKTHLLPRYRRHLTACRSALASSLVTKLFPPGCEAEATHVSAAPWLMRPQPRGAKPGLFSSGVPRPTGLAVTAEDPVLGH